MHNLSKRSCIIALLCAIVCLVTFLPTDAVVAESKTCSENDSQIVPYSGTFIAGNFAEFYYSTEISVTIPADKTARSLKVIGTVDGNSNTGAIATIKSSQLFSTPKEFPLDGQYHQFSIWSATNKTVTFTVILKSGDSSKPLRVSVILCD